MCRELKERERPWEYEIENAAKQKTQLVQRVVIRGESS
jgi:hypothetical protein